MECEACVKHVSSSLYKLDGIQKVEANLKDQLVSIQGTGSFSQSFNFHEKLLSNINVYSCPIGYCSCDPSYGKRCYSERDR